METLQPTGEPTADRSGGDRRRRSGGRRARAVAGRRRQARAERRRRFGRRMSLVMAWSAAVVGLIVIASVLLVTTPDRDTEPDGPPPVVDAPDDSQVVVLVRTAEDLADGRSPAAGLTLLSSDPTGGQSLIFLPSTSLVEIPGVGLDRLGLAQQYGGTSMTIATVENALGIEIDGGVVVDDTVLAELLDVGGGITVDVPRRLVDRDDDGNGQVAFDAGRTDLSGRRAAEYWSFRQRGETELDTFARQQVVLTELLASMTDEELVQDALTMLGRHWEPAEPTAVLDTLVPAMASAQQAGALQVHLLPVAPFGAADERLGTSYELRMEAVDELVADVLPGAIPEGGGAEAVPIQVLNGVGVPGVGQRVDRALEGLGVRIVLSDNAQDFDHEQTQVIMYDESAASLEIAQRVQQALGVGTILVSRQPQSVVDLTIVVGQDFVEGEQALAPGDGRRVLSNPRPGS